MSPEEREMLERLLRISEQNNRILRVMRREVLWSRYFRVLYMLAIVGIAVAIYYFIKPYLGSLDGAAEAAKKAQELLQR